MSGRVSERRRSALPFRGSSLDSECPECPLTIPNVGYAGCANCRSRSLPTFPEADDPHGTWDCVRVSNSVPRIGAVASGGTTVATPYGRMNFGTNSCASWIGRGLVVTTNAVADTRVRRLSAGRLGADPLRAR